MTDSFFYAANVGADHALGGEEGHLRVVGNGTFDSVCFGEIGDARWSELFADCIKSVELDGGTERVADCAAEEACLDASGGILAFRWHGAVFSQADRAVKIFADARLCATPVPICNPKRHANETN